MWFMQNKQKKIILARLHPKFFISLYFHSQYTLILSIGDWSTPECKLSGSLVWQVLDCLWSISWILWLEFFLPRYEEFVSSISRQFVLCLGNEHAQRNWEACRTQPEAVGGPEAVGCYDHSEMHSFHTQISVLEVGHEVSGLYGAPMGALRLLYFGFIGWSFIDKIIVIIWMWIKKYLGFGIHANTVYCIGSADKIRRLGSVPKIRLSASVRTFPVFTERTVSGVRL